jgi:hypothetical protein
MSEALCRFMQNHQTDEAESDEKLNLKRENRDKILVYCNRRRRKRFQVEFFCFLFAFLSRKAKKTPWKLTIS